MDCRLCRWFNFFIRSMTRYNVPKPFPCAESGPRSTQTPPAGAKAFFL